MYFSGVEGSFRSCRPPVSRVRHLLRHRQQIRCSYRNQHRSRGNVLRPVRFPRPYRMRHLLKVTITSWPKRFMFSTCLSRFSKPFFIPSIFCSLILFSGTPPCSFKLWAVATITVSFGVSPALRHLMSKNFSAPRSHRSQPL